MPANRPICWEIFEQVASAFDGESLGELHVEGKGAISVISLSRRAGDNGSYAEAP
jgi:hypothetical protein